MANTNDYLKRYNETQNNLVKPTSGLSGGDDYYKLARDQEYGLMFDKEVALENAKANALKYTQNQINSQGFGGTGYGSSLQSGIYNTYLNKANEARNDYAENVREINLQEQAANQEQANDRFQSVTTMLQGADTTENMNKLLTDYGYGSVGEDGEFHWNEQKPEGMSDDDWYQMQYYYRMQKNAFDKTETSNKGLFNYDTHFVYYDKDGNIKRREGKGEGWNWEVDTVNSYVSSGDFKNGSQIMLENLKGEKIYLTVVNGQLVYSTPSDFEKNGGYKITGKDRSYKEIKPNN